jgi:aminopeptidase N
VSGKKRQVEGAARRGKMRTDTGKTFRLEEYQPTPYEILQTRLTFRLDPERTRVISRLTLKRRVEAAADAPLVLDGEELKLVSVRLEGAELGNNAYALTPDALTLHSLPDGEFTLEIETEISPAANKALSGLYLAENIYCTQCEAEGFRRMTYFYDRPDVLSVYSVRVEAKNSAAPVLLSNGNLTSSGALADGWHFAEWHDPHPKPSYLFALVGADLGMIRDDFTTASGREVDLRIYVEHGKERMADYAMDSLKRSMKWDEERFGREYDLDIFMIVAVSSFNMGAMENKGLNVFNDKYVLADPQTATDTDYAGIEAVIAHEYFHNWTGNRITCRDWFQLCLKEGLTVYRDHEFSADQRSRAVKRITEVRGLKANQFPEDQGPLAHPPRPRKYREINNFYTSTVYEKGSEIVRMFATVLGKDLFRKGMDLYFQRHDGQAVTIEDFVKCFEKISGRDLSQLEQWYHQAGTPNLTINASWERAEKRLTLEIEQSSKATPGESRKKLLHIPVAFALFGAGGNELQSASVSGAAVENGVIHLRKKSHIVVFEGIRERPVASLLRGFSAPVTMSFEQRQEDQLFLARHESDLFSRWQALNNVATAALIAATKSARGGQTPDFDAALIEAFGEIAADERLEPAFRALALTLPMEGDIAREIGANVDPDAVLAGRQALQARIGGAFKTAFEKQIAGLADRESFSPDAASAGKRALKSALLDYAALALNAPALAADHYGAAGNMTDRIAALTILAHRFPGSAEARGALAHFEAQFAGTPLAMDKWFGAQATMPGPDALATVQSLMLHKGFSFDNPNRMRALIGVYSTSNPTGFNRKDGGGYQLLAEAVLRIDRQNPQTASRLLTAMRSWRSLEAVRKGKAREALSLIAQEKSLSTDVRDIVERMLG